jgi:sRNA-binding protein
MESIRRAKMPYHYKPDELDDVIYDLEDKYPKCFVFKPQLRRPLKNTIIADLEEDCFPATYDLLVAAVDWYKSHYGYQYALEAGAKRLDLNGKVVGTVTQTEADTAQKKIAADKQRWNERSAPYRTPPVTTATMARPKTITPPPPSPPPPAIPAIAPILTRCHETLMAANAAYIGPGDVILKAALVNAALGVLVQEAQRVIDGENS